jgi:two-component system, OmpR family, sensor kinase
VGGLSLRARLLAGVFVVAVVLAVVAVVTTTTTRAHLLDQVDSRLESARARDRGFEGFEPGSRDNPAARPPPEPVSDFYEAVILVDGRIEPLFEPSLDQDLGEPRLDVDEARAAAAQGYPYTVGSTGGGSFRVRATEDSAGRVFVSALPLDELEDTMRLLVAVEFAGTLAIAGVLGLVTWWVLRLGIRPVKRMTAAATAMAGGDLSSRIPEAAPGTEAGELGQALNRMLTSIEEAFAERSRSEERLRRFVADASHELRTPVTTIRGYAELYRAGGLADEVELAEAMRRTEQEAVRMGRLVEDMLLLAQLDRARPLETSPVDLARLVDDAVRDVRAVEPARPVSAEIDGPLVVSGDEDRLRQVLANVLANALVHTDAGTALAVRACASDGDALVEIADRGAGMEPAIVERVTERFFRADPARSRHRGSSGLGLSIVDAATAAHGGSVDIESAPGEGTTVRIRIPLGA